jgi:hypothetical protein
LKKPAGSVRFGFGFISKKPKKPNRTEPKPTKNRKKNRAKPEKPSQNRENRAKTGKTEPNRFEPVFALKNRTEPKPVGLTRFWFGFGFFFQKKINFGLVTFFYKNRTEPKMITPNKDYTS